MLFKGFGVQNGFLWESLQRMGRNRDTLESHTRSQRHANSTVREAGGRANHAFLELLVSKTGIWGNTHSDWAEIGDPTHAGTPYINTISRLHNSEGERWEGKP